MELDKVITERRSIRKFRLDLVTKEQIEKILDAGNKAPSAKNHQHWRFHVFQGEAKDKFTKFCLQEFGKKENSPEVDPNAKHSFQIMEQAPVNILVYNAHPMPFPAKPDIQSVSAAIQNMLLKAYDLGLGSLWIGYILYIENEVNEYLKTDMQLIAAIAFGYADSTPRDRRKLTVEDVTIWHE